MDFGVTRGHQRTNPTGAVENMQRLELIRAHLLLGGRGPLLTVGGSSWGPAGVSTHVLWVVRGRLGESVASAPPVPGPRGGGGHTCHITIRKCGTLVGQQEA